MAFNKAKVMEAARRAADKGQLDKAIREYFKVVREDPKDVRVWLKIGDLYAKKGEKQDATDTYLKVARFYSEQGFNRKAVAVYKQILKLDPRLVEVNLKLAELYRDLGLLSEAMQHFERVAAFFHREGKTREALATIRQLVDLDPDNVATRIKLAELYSKEGSIESAVAEFNYTLEYLRQHDREDDFLKVGERLLWHQPDNIQLNRELAAIYLRHRDPRRALQKLQVCFKADSRDVETLAMLAQAFQQLEQSDKTVSVLRELARVLTEEGQTAQATDVHEKILHYVPDDPDSLAAVRRARGAPEIESEPEIEEAPEPTDRLSADDLQVAEEGRATGAFPLVGDQHQPDAAIERADPTQEPLAEISIDEDAAFDEVGSLSGEVHADEIIKILTESDVYVKYGLHQKAIDHLRRVFDLDPHNVEAREQLKEILLSQGREGEAIAELLQLARQTVASDPGSAEMYVRELLSLDAGHPEAQELARQYGLRISDPNVEVVTEAPGAAGVPAEGGDVIPVEDDLGAPSLEEFAVGSPAPGPNPQAPEVLDEAELILDELGEAPSALGHAGTEELDLDQVEGVSPLEIAEPGARPADPGGTASDPYEALEPLGADPPTGPVTQEFQESAGHAFGHSSVDPPGPPPGEPVPSSRDVPPAHALAADPLDDPGALARDFDPTAGSVVMPEEGDATAQLRAAPAGESTDEVDEVDELSDDAIELIEGEEEASSGDTAQHAADVVDQSAGTSLEDDLDEADFFLSQGLLDEAREILDGLLRRYPDNPLITSKLEELEELGGAVDPGMAEAPGEPAEPRVAEVTATARSDPEEPDTGEVHRERPQVMLEKPIADEDADTHYDLGLAYKEMGLYDEAIKAFEKVIPARGVPCYLMIGLCYREQGLYSDAVSQFKGGLYVEGINEREKYSLYYEIGITYEQLGDAREALYYAEMVMKKDPAYRDVSDRVARLRRQVASEGASRKERDDPEGTLDRAFPDTRTR